MKLGKYIERTVKAILLAPLTLIRYGTLRPNRVKLRDCDNWIYINPKDRRAIKKFVRDPIRKRISPPLCFWRDFLAKLEPGVAIDIGVNYGECIFGTRYPINTKVFGFEANPSIAPLLQKSRIAHHDAERITIIEGLVSDTNAEDVEFYADPTWSGTGSAISSLNVSNNIVTSHIPSRRIDSVIPRNQVDNASLLFKMDIEGYESIAFEGFWETIDAAKLVIGFVEFDTTYIREAGSSPEEYFSKLADRFDIYYLSSSYTKTLVPVLSLDELPVSRASDKRVHTDLLLSTRNSKQSDWLPKQWSISDR